MTPEEARACGQVILDWAAANALTCEVAGWFPPATRPSRAQACPCAGAWKNSGAYQSCVARASAKMVADDVMSAEAKDAAVAAAAKSTCGKR